MVELKRVLLAIVLTSCSWLSSAALPQEKILIRNKTGLNLTMETREISENKQLPPHHNIVRTGTMFSLDSQPLRIISFAKDNITSSKILTSALFQQCRARKVFELSILKGINDQGINDFVLEFESVPHPLSTPAARNMQQHQAEVESKKAQAAQLEALKAKVKKLEDDNQALSTVLAQFDPGNPLLQTK